MDAKISIIIPVFNVEKYLEKCLNSLIGQTFRHFEVICVDDNSFDNSFEILKEYEKKDKRFKVFKNPKKGAASARNEGLKHMSDTKYVQFLDSDDYFEPSMLEELFNYAEFYNSDITVCSARKVDDFNNIIETKNPNSPINLYKVKFDSPFSYKDFPDDIFNILTPVLWNKLYLKRLILDNNMFFADLNICEDIAFSYSLMVLAKKIVVFEKELINYRFARCGSMASYRSKYLIDVISAFLELKKFLKEKNLFETFKTPYTKALKNHVRWECGFCFNNQHYKRFLEKFEKFFPSEYEICKPILKKDFITAQYLKKIIGAKKAMLWGASFYIQNILSKEKEKNPNILGIIDKNLALEGKMCGNYKIYAPEKINELKPDIIIMTVWSNNDEAYEALSLEIEEKYPKTKLYPNIFQQKYE